MRILITGGAGFIGSHTALILKKDNDIAVIDNLDSYYQLRLKQYNLKNLKKNKIPFYKTDILDKKSLKEIFSKFKPEIIIHLAAKAGVRNSILYPEEYFSINVDGTLNVLQASKLFGAKKVMVASSSSVYGTNTKVPFSENDKVENQISPYAASKRAMEVLCKMYSKVYNLNIQVFRLFTVYGPSGRPDMAPALFTAAIAKSKSIKVFGSLNTERDYTYIDDIIDGLKKAIDVNDRFEIYNLGNNKPVILKDFIEIIETEFKKEAKLEFISFQVGDVPKTWADIKKSQSTFNYKPRYSIKQGLAKFIKWYKQHKELY